MPRRRLVRNLVVLFLLCSGITHAAEQTGLRKIRAAITSISGSMSPAWAAHESGLFAKHGLQVEVVAMPSGLQGITTLAAREVDFVHIAGGTTAGAAIGGLDVKIIATLVGTLVLNLVVRPEIEKPEQLRGKTIGISRYGTSLHTGARIALRHLGLADGKDVAIAEIGAGEWIVGAMQGGRIHGGVFGYPQTSRAIKLGNRLMLHLPTLNIAYAANGVSTRGELARNDPDLVRRYLSAIVETSALMKKDRAFSYTVLRKYLRTADPDLLSETYDVQIAKYLLKIPLPTVDNVRSVVEEIAERNPKARDQDPKLFFDDRFIRQLESSGFIDSVYR